MPLQRSLREGLQQCAAPPVLNSLLSDNLNAHPASYVALASIRRVIDRVVCDCDPRRGAVTFEP